MHILKRETYDAIVVGSGISGGMAAKELCEKGLKTLVLERGRPLTHGVDYVTEHKNSWEFDYRNGGPTPRMQEEYPYIARTGYAIREATEHLLLKDADNPYIEEKPFTWVRGGRVGG
ncbi:MAG: NAD(P)-binding protein, partial [Bacteroidota bacterium]